MGHRVICGQKPRLGLLITILLVAVPLWTQNQTPANPPPPAKLRTSTNTTTTEVRKESIKRLDESAVVLSKIMATDHGIPQEIIEIAQCIVIVPAVKTAKYGNGDLSCRNKGGTGWSAPGTVRIEAGSVGFQIGGSESDLIIFVMTAGAAEKLLSKKFTLGVDGTLTVGPVGGGALTDAQMHADVLSWSRSQGIFEGLALVGATLQQDPGGNAELYGKKLNNRDIVTSGIAVPEGAARLIGLLNKYSLHK